LAKILLILLAPYGKEQDKLIELTRQVSDLSLFKQKRLDWETPTHGRTLQVVFTFGHSISFEHQDRLLTIHSPNAFC
jgi:hypothetical protein